MKKDINKKIIKPDYENANNNEKLIINFQRINHTMHFLYEGRGSQNKILTILLDKENITQQELTELLGIKPGSASEVISKLEKNGLINKSKSLFDRRTANISLTEKGRCTAEEAKKQQKESHTEIFCSLNEDEKNTLLSLLEKINSDLENNFPQSNRYHHCKGAHNKKHHHEAFNNEGHYNQADNKNGCDKNCSECPHPCGKRKNN